MPRLLDSVNFPKLVTALAVTFCVALGACGLTAFVSKWGGGYVLPLGLVELAVIVLSGAGLLISVILWVVAAAFGSGSAGEPDMIRLFDDSDKKS